MAAPAFRALGPSPRRCDVRERHPMHKLRTAIVESAVLGSGGGECLSKARSLVFAVVQARAVISDLRGPWLPMYSARWMTDTR